MRFARFVRRLRWFGSAGVVVLAGCAVGATNPTVATAVSATVSSLIASLTPYADATGTVSTYTSAGNIDTAGVFFQSLGTNGRSCASCHQLAQGMSVAPAAIQALFVSSAGSDPLFDAVDGANCPTAANGDSAARSLLLNSGLVRVALTLTAGAQFTLTTISDPYGCAVTTVGGVQTVSVYRRPLASTGIGFLSNVMWDTRETIAPLNSAASFSAALNTDLSQQAADAVAIHMQGAAAPTAAQIAGLISFMEGLETAQADDLVAGSLSGNGGNGGAANLAATSYYPGINDAFGADPLGVKFNPKIFNLYGGWQNDANAQRASISRGEQIFNGAPMVIENVRGINDNAALGSPATLNGSCGTCHDAPNVGSHSLALPLDTGVARSAAGETDQNIVRGLGALAAPLLPVYQISGCKDVNGKAVTYVTSDPGRALVTGLCADVNRVKVPSLRGLAARGPYFHNGSAVSLTELVGFYNARFQMKLNAQQQVDLVNFLGAL